MIAWASSRCFLAETAVIRDGTIRQIGSPAALYDYPADSFVAGSVGTANLLVGKVFEDEAGQTRFFSEATGEVSLFERLHRPSAGAAMACFRPTSVRFAPYDAMTDADDTVWMRGRIVRSEFRGGYLRYSVSVGDETVVCDLPLPETPETRNMMGAAQFAQMKEGAIFLNASRGTVVDIDALVSALESNHLAGAAVDVFPVEPATNKDPFVSPLQRFDNVLLTPHIGASTLEAQALFAVAAAPEQSCTLWVGAMAPKRWARRAVTRNAIKRQVYTLFDPHVHPPAGQLPQAAFVVRLSKAFDRKRYPSAWSEALRLAVRAELEQLLARATRPTTPPCAPPGEQA